MYEMENDGENASSDQVRDEAFNEIVEDDIFFEKNKDRLSLDSYQIDLCLLDKYKCARFLGQRLHIINRCWKNLTNVDEHTKLQKTIKLEVMKF